MLLQQFRKMRSAGTSGAVPTKPEIDCLQKRRNLSFQDGSALKARIWRLSQVLLLLSLCAKGIMMFQEPLLAALLIWSPVADAGYDSDGSYIQQTQDTLAKMQQTYWNGSYWPDTIQWMGAVMDTIVASTQITFASTLFENNRTAPDASMSDSELQSDINKYYSQIRAYYAAEDTNQIFDAAYDDAQWVVLEWLEVIKFIERYSVYFDADHSNADIGDFAHRAHIFYNIVQDKFDMSQCDGGITWNPALGTYKNAITNELFLSSSIAMYLYFPGDNNTDPYPSPTYQATTNKTLQPLPTLEAHDPLLLDNAKKEWAWFKSHNFTNSQGLIVDGFHISDGQTSCDQRNEMVYTYNQGVMLSGLRGLWEATGDVSYLDDGYTLISTAINATGWKSQIDKWAGLGRNGVMEDYCDAPANCSQDNLIFKGAYFEHLDLFCEPLPTSNPLVPGLTYLADEGLANIHASNCAGYAPWVEKNAAAALSTKNSDGIVGEWWNAPPSHNAQTSSPLPVPAKPAGSIDICNEPWLLDGKPWACDSQADCKGSSRKNRRLASTPSRLFRRQSNNQYTVETQAQGLSVIRAAADLAMRIKSHSEALSK